MESNKKHSRSFWDDDVPLALLEIEPNEIPKFDVIVIDEGQDFKNRLAGVHRGTIKRPKLRSLVFFWMNNKTFLSIGHLSHG